MNCLAKAFSIALDIPYDDLIKEIGHDGSKKIWPTLPEPMCYQSFHPGELIIIAFRHGFTVTPFEVTLESCCLQCRVCGGPDYKKLHKISCFLPLKGNKGVVTGDSNIGRHAAYWDGQKTHDGSLIAVECFWLVKRFSCDHGLTFNSNLARGLSSMEVRKRWPRLDGLCPKGCGENGIHYASWEHYQAGDW